MGPGIDSASLWEELQSHMAKGMDVEKDEDWCHKCNLPHSSSGSHLYISHITWLFQGIWPLPTSVKLAQDMSVIKSGFEDAVFAQ